MGLMVLKLNRERKLKEQELDALVKKREVFLERDAALASAIDEAETDEDMKAVEDEIDTHEADKGANEEAIRKLEEAISRITADIEDAEKRAKEAVKPKPPEKQLIGSERAMDEVTFSRVRNAAERKERMRKVYLAEEARAKSEGKERSDLRSFIEGVTDMVQKRAINGAELLVPEVLFNMIEIDLQYVGGMINLVRFQPVGGTARIIMSGDAPKAVWVDNCDAITELGDLSFNMTEIDAFKLAGFMAVCNSTIDDAFIDLAAHIQAQMVKGFKLALDEAALKGQGPTAKQPTGILPSVPAGNRVTSSPEFAEYLKNYALLPDDAVVEAAVMTRKTYFEYFMPQTVQVDSAGRIIVGNMLNPVLPDGTPVVFVRKDQNLMTDGQVLTGQFSKYFMAQRKGMTLDLSTDFKFTSDQTVFRIIGRYDGKPLEPEYFLLITLTEISPIMAPVFEPVAGDEDSDGPVNLQDKTNAELLEIAEGLSLTGLSGKTKAEIVAAIEAAI